MSLISLIHTRVMGYDLWVMCHWSLVMGHVSCVMGHVSWVIGNGVWVIRQGSWGRGHRSFVGS